MEDRAAKLQREARDNASGGSHGNEKAPASADKADAKNAQEMESESCSPQLEANLPSKVDTHASTESQGNPETKPPAGPSTSQEVPQRSGEDGMSVSTQDGPVSPPKVSRPGTSLHSAPVGSAGREEGKPSVVSPADVPEEDKHSPIQRRNFFTYQTRHSE